MKYKLFTGKTFQMSSWHLEKNPVTFSYSKQQEETKIVKTDVLSEKNN